ncbi:Protein piccolo [Blattella germanica]|nr:Protein piccolo [Blattella germanica]
MSGSEKRTSLSADMEEPDVGIHPVSRRQPNRGEVQLQVCYDKKAHILYVIVKRARNLNMFQDAPPDPLIKVCLLPGRKTRYFSRTCDPEWNSTMVYENVSPEELNTRYLEVTAWNYDIYHPNHFLGGVILDLSDPNVLDEEARWYFLQDDPMLQASLNSHSSGFLQQ